MPLGRPSSSPCSAAPLRASAPPRTAVAAHESPSPPFSGGVVVETRAPSHTAAAVRRGRLALWATEGDATDDAGDAADSGDVAGENAQLREENARLRAELAQLSPGAADASVSSLARNVTTAAAATATTARQRVEQRARAASEGDDADDDAGADVALARPAPKVEPDSGLGLITIPKDPRIIGNPQQTISLGNFSIDTVRLRTTGRARRDGAEWVGT